LDPLNCFGEFITLFRFLIELDLFFFPLFDFDLLLKHLSISLGDFFCYDVALSFVTSCLSSVGLTAYTVSTSRSYEGMSKTS